jgi:hypothetical protein
MSVRSLANIIAADKIAADSLEAPDRFVLIDTGRNKKLAWMNGIPVTLRLDPVDNSILFKGGAPDWVGVVVKALIVKDVKVNGKRTDEMRLDSVFFNFEEDNLQAQTDAFINSKVARAMIGYAQEQNLTIVVPNQAIERAMREEVKNMRLKDMLREDDVNIAIKPADDL